MFRVKFHNNVSMGKKSHSPQFVKDYAESSTRCARDARSAARPLHGNKKPSGIRRMQSILFQIHSQRVQTGRQAHVPEYNEVTK
jgi:hypothetical protein